MDDWGFEDFDAEAPATAKPQGRELVPEGEHVFRIERAKDTDQEFAVTLAHSSPAYGWVWAKMPKGKSWAARLCGSLARALGMTREQWQATEIGELIGRQVTAEIYHRVGNSGVTFVNVRKFTAAPGEPASVTTKPAARTGKQRTAAAGQGGTNDDIPF